MTLAAAVVGATARGRRLGRFFRMRGRSMAAMMRHASSLPAA
jgi:hypothetical protein